MTQKLRWIAAAGGLLFLAAPAAPAHAVQFSLPTQVPFSSTPRDVVLVDLDRDGTQDLVAATAGGITVRRGTTPRGSEPVTYAPAVAITTASGTVAVDAADLDGDQRPEIVAAAQQGAQGGSIIILRNRSAQGTIDLFRDPQKVYGDLRADSVAVVDANRKGFADDIAYTNAATGQLFVLVNTTVNVANSGIEFTQPGVGIPAGADPVAVTGGDVTGDRVSDFIVANRTPGTVTVLENITPQNDTTPTVRDRDTVPGVTGASSVVTADVGGKVPERLDIVAGGVNGFHVIANDTPGIATPRVYDNKNFRAAALDDVVVADVDEAKDASGAPLGPDLLGLRAQDGDLDVAVDNGAGYAPAATFDASNQGTPVTALGLALGDANSDGDPDVAVADGADEVAVLLRTPEVRPGTTLPISWREDTPPVVVDPAVTVSSPGDELLEGATARVIGAGAGDRLDVPARDGITTSFDAASATLTMRGSGSAATYQELLRQVVFSSPGDDPDDGRRDVGFSVTDGVRSPEARRAVDVIAVNDAPGVALSSPSSFFEPTAAPSALDPGIALGDPDSEALTSARISISRGYRPGEDRLRLPQRNGFTSEFFPDRGELTIRGTQSLAAWQEALRTVTFDTVGGSIDLREITIVVVDDGRENAQSAPATRAFAFRPVNQVGPSLSGSAVVGQTLTANPGQWRGTAPITFGYRWQRCTAAGCVDIPGATGQSHVVQAADGGSRLRAVVIADNPAPGEERAETAQSALVPVAPSSGIRPATASGSTLPRVFSVSGRALRDGRVRLTVRAPRAGRLDVARLVDRRRTQLAASRTAVRAGTTTITLRPTAAVRSLVRDRGLLALNLRVAYRPQRGAVVRRVVRVVVRRVVISRAQALASGQVRLTVKAPFAGRLSLARVRSGRTTALSARTVVVRKGTTRVTLPTTAAVKRLVRSRGSVRLTLRATYRPVRRAASRESVSVTLRRR